MKIKEYIEFKRQYFPPKVKVHKILDEGILAGGSPWVEGSDITKDPNETGGGNPQFPPFVPPGTNPAKAGSFVVDDDVE